MGVGAILVINDRPSYAGTCAEFDSRAHTDAPRGPITCIDILGQSILDRMIVRLRNAGVEAITVIAGCSWDKRPAYRAVKIISTANGFSRWPAAQQALIEQKSQGIDTVLMIGLGAYMELSLTAALEFHRTTGTPLTQVEDENGSLDFWIVDSNWFSTAATGCTLPFRYGEFPGLPVSCRLTGYVNRLTDVRDLRQLVRDAFLSECEIKPQGVEVRPGIWIDEGARVHKSARLVAPVYVGRNSKVGPSAVLTRYSNVEHSCEIGTGTVVEGSSILPHTVLGYGLEISNAVVSGNRVVDLKRNIALQIDDLNLIRDSAPPKWHSPAHWEFALRPANGKERFAFDYPHYLTRAAGRLSEVFFKG